MARPSRPLTLFVNVEGVGHATLEGTAVTYVYYAGSSVSGTRTSAAPVAAGIYTVVASFAGSADYNPASSQAGFVILPPPLVVSGGEALDLGGRIETVGAVTVEGGSVADGTLSGTSYVVQRGTVTAGFSGAGALTKETEGTVVLGGANNYTGGTKVSAGTLVVSNSRALPVGTSLTVAAGGCLVFDPSQAAASDSVVESATPASVTAAAPLAVGQATSTVNNRDATATGVLSAAGIAPALAAGTTAPQGHGVALPVYPAHSARVKYILPTIIASPVLAKNQMQAHDAVLQSLNTRAAVEEQAAALWNWDSSWASGPSDRKHDSSDSATDAVMAMMGRTST